MRKYKVVEKLGEGSFASVHRCTLIDDDSGHKDSVFAVKRMKQKFSSWKECKRLREVQALTKLKHRNIIRCNEVILEPSCELYLVFEYAPKNLWQLICDQSEVIDKTRITSLMFQLLDGLAYIHKQGIFHRDIKPENLLIRYVDSSESQRSADDEGKYSGDVRIHEVLKIADFGCMREIRSRPPFTNYVATRWYRAPELLVRSTMYSSPVDIWAAGVIMCELFLRQNLFPGESDVDMLHLIYSKLGSPRIDQLRRDSIRNIMIPNYKPVPFASMFSGSELGECKVSQHLASQLLLLDPSKRPTANQCLKHNFFTSYESPHLRLTLSSPKKIAKDVEYFSTPRQVVSESSQCGSSSNVEDIDSILDQVSFDDVPDLCLGKQDVIDEYLDAVQTHSSESESKTAERKEVVPSIEIKPIEHEAIDTDEIDSLLHEIIEQRQI